MRMWSFVPIGFCLLCVAPSHHGPISCWGGKEACCFLGAGAGDGDRWSKLPATTSSGWQDKPRECCHWLQCHTAEIIDCCLNPRSTCLIRRQNNRGKEKRVAYTVHIVVVALYAVYMLQLPVSGTLPSLCTPATQSVLLDDDEEEEEMEKQYGMTSWTWPWEDGQRCVPTRKIHQRSGLFAHAKKTQLPSNAWSLVFNIEGCLS